MSFVVTKVIMICKNIGLWYVRTRVTQNQLNIYMFLVDNNIEL